MSFINANHPFCCHPLYFRSDIRDQANRDCTHHASHAGRKTTPCTKRPRRHLIQSITTSPYVPSFYHTSFIILYLFWYTHDLCCLFCFLFTFIVGNLFHFMHKPHKFCNFQTLPHTFPRKSVWLFALTVFIVFDTNPLAFVYFRTGRIWRNGA